MSKKSISKTQAALLCFFFGSLGVHRMVMGYKNWWMMTLTLGLFWIWSWIDLIRILAGKMPMANGKPLH